jgi:proline iminopeptidase
MKVQSSWLPVSFLGVILFLAFDANGVTAQSRKSAGGSRAIGNPIAAPVVHPMQDGFVDANGVMIYYEMIGTAQAGRRPLVIVHGGPGASHDYFLPYLLPLARGNQLVFIDERGSGRSSKLGDPSGYTAENMVEDVEAVRVALGLGKINLLGHSYGGALAQAYALKYQKNLTRLILASTWSSTLEFNKILVQMKEKMAPELRERINRMEASGLFGKGKDYEKGRYTTEYMVAAWGEGYFPYLYRNRPDANYDPIASGVMAWDLYREMWGEHGEFVVDGNLKSVEYTERLATIKVPTLILVGDHDECDPSLSRAMQEKITGSEIVVLPTAGHMTFVDQTGLFVETVEKFLEEQEGRN